MNDTVHLASHEPRVAPPTIKQPEITLSVAFDETMLTSFRRLAYEEYKKRGWLNPTEYPDGIVTDEYDSASTVLVVCADDDVVAGTRIVHDRGLGFPHELEIGFDRPIPVGLPETKPLELLRRTPRERIAEITKVVGKRKQRTLTIDIIKCLYWYARMSKLDLYVMVVDLDFFQLCSLYGIPIEPIGAPMFCEGSWTIPAITVPSRYPDEVTKKSERSGGYIATADNLDHTWSVH